MATDPLTPLTAQELAMSSPDLAQWYLDSVGQLRRDWLRAGLAFLPTDSALADRARLWADAVRSAEEILIGALKRSAAETGDALDALQGLPDPAFNVRLADLARSRASLWAAAGLAAAERLGRAVPADEAAWVEFPPLPAELAASAPSARAWLLGVIAAELWLGYAMLRERARWAPGLVEDKDWVLQHRRGAGRVLDTAKTLGGSLIKAAQFASTRPDLLPRPYIDGLAELQDRLPPQPWTQIERAIEQELGRPLTEVFAEIDPNPVAAASIAQVHRARLKDGREVAVKVQYPDIAALVKADLDAMEQIVATIGQLEPDVQLGPILEYLRWTLPMELDFRREAEAAAALGAALAGHERARVPAVVDALSTGRLLVMDWASGIKITDRDGLAAADIDVREVAELLIDVYAEQLFRHGVFHADPHPGNLFVQRGPAGPVLVLLDHGLTTRVPPALLQSLRASAAALQNADLQALSAALKEVGLDLDPEQDTETLLWMVGLLLGGDRLEAAMGTAAAGGAGDSKDVARLGRQLGARIAGIGNDLLLVGRGMGLVDGISRQLAPGLDTLSIVARHAGAAGASIDPG
jgi:predicted unusual protein kinase regulating ubiquinone biosynthesis (AarF/ABC1/UbiB family)